MEFPITVSAIIMDKEATAYDPNCMFGKKCGDFVAVRIAGEPDTHLGILLGEFPTGLTAFHDPDTKELKVGFDCGNPAIYIPQQQQVVFGYQSWWRKIEREEQLNEITDEQIADTWYVKALKQKLGL